MYLHTNTNAHTYTFWSKRAGETLGDLLPHTSSSLLAQLRASNRARPPALALPLAARASSRTGQFLSYFQKFLFYGLFCSTYLLVLLLLGHTRARLARRLLSNLGKLVLWFFFKKMKNSVKNLNLQYSLKVLHVYRSSVRSKVLHGWGNEGSKHLGSKLLGSKLLGSKLYGSKALTNSL
jgi:hypothetical protein